MSAPQTPPTSCMHAITAAAKRASMWRRSDHAALLLLLFRHGITGAGHEAFPAIPRAGWCSEGARPVEVGIVGGGIAGLALARALQLAGHGRFSASVFERDPSFRFRRQGYALTIQQGSAALERLGLLSKVQAEDVECSGMHYVFDSDGGILGCFGPGLQTKKQREHAKRRNWHLPRERLREILYTSLLPGTVKWGHRLVAMRACRSTGGLCWRAEEGHLEQIALEFDGGEAGPSVRVFDVVVGADGIRSEVRRLLGDDAGRGLQYLQTMVILGISPSQTGEEGVCGHPLLDGQCQCSSEEGVTRGEGAPVFQTVDGMTRMYCMPFNRSHTFWQLSFQIEEEDALNMRGDAEALRALALSRCGAWHRPIPDLVHATDAATISGFPVYDRPCPPSQSPAIETGPSGPKPPGQANAAEEARLGAVTLIGDASHPMSPFKGQGANQALLDATALADALTTLAPVLAEDVADGLRFAAWLEQVVCVCVCARARVYMCMQSNIHACITRGCVVWRQ